MRILITGAAGSGTSTLAAAMAVDIKGKHLDADDFLWLPTPTPYTALRPKTERLAHVLRAMVGNDPVVLAGSIMGWGEELEQAFDSIVFLRVETSIRLERIQARELRRFGKVNEEFLEWAAQYETGPPEGRSLQRHLAWLSERSCPVITLTGALSVQQQLAVISTQASDAMRS